MDGKLRGIFVPTVKYNDAQKIDIFTKLVQKKLFTNPNAAKAVLLISQNAGNQNYQVENDVDASDVLAEIIMNKSCDDLIQTIQEQLSDIITSGVCPSGRVTRLLQVWDSMQRIGHENDVEISVDEEEPVAAITM